MCVLDRSHPSCGVDKGAEQSKTEARAASWKTPVIVPKKRAGSPLGETTNPGGNSAQLKIRLKREGRGFAK